MICLGREALQAAGSVDLVFRRKLKVDENRVRIIRVTHESPLGVGVPMSAPSPESHLIFSPQLLSKWKEKECGGVYVGGSQGSAIRGKREEARLY